MNRQSNNRRLGMENLESRKMLTTTHLILDFTPDTHAGSFADTFFNTKYSSGYAPNWLDFDGNRYINMDDVNIAAKQINNQVGGLFNASANGQNVLLKWGDTGANTNWGSRYLQWGQQYPSEQVAVMYIGG